MKAIEDVRARTLVPPVAVAWSSAGKSGALWEVERLLSPGPPQAGVGHAPLVALRSTASNHPGFMLDFGEELYGGIRLVVGRTDAKRTPRLRVRFGESYAEAMGEPNQDHAIHDQLVPVAWLGSTEVGSTGFRFVRIDLVDDDATVDLQGIWAVSVLRPLEQLGTFQCSDDRLNRIWQVGARTVHLCMQDYLWDGVKRDRLVWVGDMHPEARVISAVFGQHPIVPASLDFARDEFPLPAWMNGISSYSLWWIICHHDWFQRYGQLEYLREQQSYLLGLLRMALRHLDARGRETLTGNRFLDWPTSADPAAVHAGLQALMVLALSAGADLCDALGEAAPAANCRDAVVRLRQHVTAAPGSKSANALLALAGLFDPARANQQELAVDPLRGVSTFYGYYVLEARARAGDLRGCLDLIRTYWGAMLDRGATTFWEDFDLGWLKNSGRIDAAPSPGQRDLHADFGGYCYAGLRRSLCHGWAAGPTAWLSEHMLGVTPAAPGFTVARVRPNFVDLEWARGTYPTPHGLIHVELKRYADGTPEVTVDAPPGVRVERDEAR